MKSLVLSVAFIVPMSVAYASKIDCYTDPRTDAMTCIDMDSVRERDGIRVSPVYTGGPNGVRKTTFTIHSNCKTGVTHLKDKDGVSFAGGVGNETPALISLRGSLCSASVTVLRKK